VSGEKHNSLDLVSVNSEDVAQDSLIRIKIFALMKRSSLKVCFTVERSIPTLKQSEEGITHGKL